MKNGTNDTTEKDLRFGFVLNTGFTVFELVVGLASGSLALVSDALHNLTDSLSIVVSYGGQKLSRRRADEQHTFGHGGAAVVAALVNASILVGLSVLIFTEAAKRFNDPEPVSGELVAVVASIGIAINSLVALRFLRNKNNINIRSAFLNMALDALASLGALIAGLLMAVTGNAIFDPIISLIIGILLLISAGNIIKRAVHILLAGTPVGVDIKAVRQSILNCQEVRGLDDLHLWNIGAEDIALTCHVIAAVDSQKNGDELISRIKRLLTDTYGISHATIELHSQSGPHDNERTDEGLM